MIKSIIKSGTKTVAKAKTFFSKLIHKYSVSKTLRFELIPQGKTLHFIKKRGILTQDTVRAHDYKRCKELIDEYHKNYIEEKLSHFQLKNLDKYHSNLSMSKKNQEDKNIIEDITKKMREEIAYLFNDNPAKLENQKTLINKTLVDQLTNQKRIDDLSCISKFNKFTSYFTSFSQNRLNIYSKEAHSSAISFRIINENFPKHSYNINTFEKISKLVDLSIVEKNFKKQLNGESLRNIFKPKFFNNCLNQQGIDFYNLIIGGISNENGTKLQGINELINLHRQKNGLTNRELPLLRKFHKQILSDREISFLPDEFNNIKEAVDGLYNFVDYMNQFKINNKKKHILSVLKTFFNNLKSFDLSGIFVSQKSLTQISQQIFGNYKFISEALKFNFEFENKGERNLEKLSIKYLKNKYFSIEEIQQALNVYLKGEAEGVKEFTNLKNTSIIVNYFKAFTTNIELDDKFKKTNLFDLYEEKCLLIVDKLKNQNESSLILNKKTIATIKEYVDTIMYIKKFISPLRISSIDNIDNMLSNQDSDFYEKFDELYDHISAIVPLYNKLRNFASKKPYVKDKIKINFQQSTLLSGWSVSKEKNSLSVLLRKDDLYYLAIMNKEDNKSFESLPKSLKSESCYEKMNYKFLPDPKKMLPKVFFAASNVEFFNPSAKILDIYQNKTFKKEHPEFSIKNLHLLIDFFKNSFNKHSEWSKFDFKRFKPTASYTNLSQFYDDIEADNYSVDFIKVSETYIDQLVEDGKIYLFQLHNKDFSKFASGKENLHTIYWKSIFSEENLKNAIHRLNGGAEIFYRPASISKRNIIIHKKNEFIENKNPLNEKSKSKFKYDIIKDRRFTQDKFHFHVPILLNAINEKQTLPINKEVNELIKNDKSVNIIGFDRGEKNLLYYSVINQKGEIIEQGSLNTITSNNQAVSYHSLLDSKETERNEARKSWNTINTIKEIKNGYMSQVVHKVQELMIQYNAIICLEDLNKFFKRGRFKIEKQVYQNFEKMLINKLNFIVDKNIESEEIGGIRNALQLTAPFETFDKIGHQKQSGIIYYVPAHNTSKIDFATGFVNMIYPKYENEEKSKILLDKFDTIIFNRDQNYFEFEVDYKKFIDNGQELSLTKWVICSYGTERYFYNPLTRETIKIDVTEKLKLLFDEYKIRYKSGMDLKSAIIQNADVKFYKNFINYFRLILNLRYTDGKNKDYILSPVADQNGQFFNTLSAGKNEPLDADANGAYHIAMKGLLMIKKIQNQDKNLFISNAEWHNFIQDMKSKKFKKKNLEFA